MQQSRRLNGGCLCGGVRYRLSGPMREVVNCFCDQCKKTSGHYVAATSVASADLTLLAESTLRWYQSSDVAERGFCNRCGGNLFWRKLGADKTSIMAGTIDHPTGLRTAENIFTEDKSDYHSLPETTSC
ncbi:MAG: GFA family protein [Acidiferrobacterales bacterium]|nr:GFA family protein [Acidiferrobacterales bacterium]